MPYGYETWALKKENIIERADIAIIRWICGVLLRDRVSSSELTGRLCLESVEELMFD